MPQPRAPRLGYPRMCLATAAIKVAGVGARCFSTPPSTPRACPANLPVSECQIFGRMWGLAPNCAVVGRRPLPTRRFASTPSAESAGRLDRGQPLPVIDYTIRPAAARARSRWPRLNPAALQMLAHVDVLRPSHTIECHGSPLRSAAGQLPSWLAPRSNSCDASGGCPS